MKTTSNPATSTKGTNVANISKVKTTSTTAKVETKEPVKEKVKKEAASANLLSVLPVIDKGLFISKVRGGTRENVYHKELFENLSEGDSKTLRRNLRTNLEKFAASFIEYATNKDKKKLAALKESFEAYYKKVYRVNDLTPESILPGNAGDDKKAQVVKMLEILKGIK